MMRVVLAIESRRPETVDADIVINNDAGRGIGNRGHYQQHRNHLTARILSTSNSSRSSNTANTRTTTRATRVVTAEKITKPHPPYHSRKKGSYIAASAKANTTSTRTTTTTTTRRSKVSCVTSRAHCQSQGHRLIRQNRRPLVRLRQPDAQGSPRSRKTLRGPQGHEVGVSRLALAPRSGMRPRTHAGTSCRTNEQRVSLAGKAKVSLGIARSASLIGEGRRAAYAWGVVLRRRRGTPRRRISCSLRMLLPPGVWSQQTRGRGA